MNNDKQDGVKLYWPESVLKDSQLKIDNSLTNINKAE